MQLEIACDRALLLLTAPGQVVKELLVKMKELQGKGMATSGPPLGDCPGLLASSLESISWCPSCTQWLATVSSVEADERTRQKQQGVESKNGRQNFWWWQMPSRAAWARCWLYPTQRRRPSSPGGAESEGRGRLGQVRGVLVGESGSQGLLEAPGCLLDHGLSIFLAHASHGTWRLEASTA